MTQTHDNTVPRKEKTPFLLKTMQNANRKILDYATTHDTLVRAFKQERLAA